jgi:hypothetical protein
MPGQHIDRAADLRKRRGIGEAGNASRAVDPCDRLLAVGMARS